MMANLMCDVSNWKVGPMTVPLILSLRAWGEPRISHWNSSLNSPSSWEQNEI